MSRPTTYPRYFVTYRDRRGLTCEASLRIHVEVTDLAAAARRQIAGNHMSVSEILSVARDHS